MAGPALVEIATLDGGSYCIDATEVSNADYEAWLSTTPDAADQPASCAWNTTFTPSMDWPAPVDQGLRPVAWVDWCDARAYCAGVGKSLCGKIGGGPNAFSDQTDATKSAWFNACSAGGANTFPYGAEYDPALCNGQEHPADASIDVGSAPGCVGGSPGVFDMSGNVWEWEDSCETEDGAADLCRRRGGSFFSAADVLTCAIGADDTRSMADDSIGFRCCF
jgi:formylglycine-generating enzyme required for sulfatase activity